MTGKAPQGGAPTVTGHLQGAQSPPLRAAGRDSIMIILQPWAVQFSPPGHKANTEYKRSKPEVWQV